MTSRLPVTRPSTAALDWEQNLNLQTAVISIACANAAAVDNGDSLGDGQPQSGATGLMFLAFGDAIEGFKDAIEGLEGNAIAVVGNENASGLGTTAGDFEGDCHLRVWLCVVNGVPHYVFNATSQ